jgi:hypothetical protein
LDCFAGLTPILAPETQSCGMAIVSGGEPPFPTLRLSRLNDLPGNLKASQPEDAILEALNRSMAAQAGKSRSGEGRFTPADLRQVQLSGSWSKLASAAVRFPSAPYQSLSLNLRAIRPTESGRIGGRANKGLRPTEGACPSFVNLNACSVESRRLIPAFDASLLRINACSESSRSFTVGRRRNRKRAVTSAQS